MIEGIKDAFDGILLHGNKEAAGELLAGSSCIEESGGCMGHELLRDEIVGLKCLLEVDRAPECEGDTHPKMLRALEDLAVRVLEEICALEGLKPEIVEEEVAGVINACVDRGSMLAYNSDEFIRHVGMVLTSLRIFLVGQLFDDCGETCLSITLVIRDDDT